MRHALVLAVPSFALLTACGSAGSAAPAAAEATPSPTAVASAPAPETSGSETADATPPPEESAAPVATAATPHHHHAAQCGEVRVTFDPGSFTLTAEEEQRLDAYAACVESERARVLYVQGSTDPSGTEADNLVLARRRGHAVAEYLHHAGVHTDFEIHSLGEIGALPSRQVWPDERAATVSDTHPQ